jgi:hypothetical protein
MNVSRTNHKDDKTLQHVGWEKDCSNCAQVFPEFDAYHSVGGPLVLKTKNLAAPGFGPLPASHNGMIAQTMGSEPGTLLLLGGSLVAASIILRRLATFVFRMFDREGKNQPEQAGKSAPVNPL